MIFSKKTAHPVPAPVPARPMRSWRQRVLGVGLVQKIIIANGFVILVSLLLWERILAVSAQGRGPLAITVAGILLASALLNAILVHLALLPVSDLARIAERVRDGDTSARTPPSPLADPGIDRLRLVFNDMLDQVGRLSEVQRHRSHLMIQAEERDRERMSDGLYGDTAQTLAAVLVQLRLLEHAIERGEDPRKTSDSVTQSIRDALDDVRDVARKLRPPELHDLGVRKAIEAFGREITERDACSQTSLTIEGDLPEHRLDEPSRIALFRIVQEAIRNAVEHAKASTIRIEFSSGPNELRVAVTDDGCGFDSTSPRVSEVVGYGILAMTERARFADGSLSIDSCPSQGSRVSLALPLTDSPPAIATSPAVSDLTPS